MEIESIAKLSDSLNKKDFSSVELCSHYLERIKRLNPDLNCFVDVFAQHALSEAVKVDKERAKGTTHPLAGIPIAHKDIFCTQGFRTACGSRMLDNFIAPYDATLIKHCKQAGLIMLGKTNMDEFAMGSSNENSFYGSVKNPWDRHKVPGGSSGGSAAVVAADLAPIATGTDTGGSVRQPASFCGITGLKPTYGRVSRYGMIGFASSLDQAGLFARSAEDIALILEVIAGFDERDSTSIRTPVPDYKGYLNNSLKGVKIGLLHATGNALVSPKLENIMLEAKQVYEKLGAEFIDIELPNLNYTTACYYVIAPAECSSNLARYDGVRFGYRCDNPKDLNDLYCRSRSEGFGDEVKRRILIGTYVLSAGYYDAYYRKAQQARRLISQDFQNVFSEVDMILSPVTTGTAFGLNAKKSDHINMYKCDHYTIPVNLAGLPAISAPSGFIDGLPIGHQLIANHFKEADLLNAVHQYQQITDWHQKKPEGI